MVQLAVQDTNREFIEAFNRGNAESVAALYTEDATLLPPNSEPIRGRQAIEAFWKGAIEMGMRDAVLETAYAEYLGDTAYEIGNYRAKIEPAGGQATTDRGKYVVVWKRAAGGSWKLHVDIWNSSLPPAGQ